MKIHPVGVELFHGGQTDLTKLTVAFRILRTHKKRPGMAEDFKLFW